nr:uncharacterized protein LOC111413876 [Onthophagus taurus]XP_022909155.1 uncharacterized protein LOC111420409 [Onthophagus taurus]
MAPINRRNFDRGDNDSGLGTQSTITLSTLSSRQASTTSKENSPNIAIRSRKRVYRGRWGVRSRAERRIVDRVMYNRIYTVRVKNVWDCISHRKLHEMYKNITSILSIVKRNRRNENCDVDFCFTSRQEAAMFVLAVECGCIAGQNKFVRANIIP